MMHTLQVTSMEHMDIMQEIMDFITAPVMERKIFMLMARTVSDINLKKLIQQQSTHCYESIYLKVLVAIICTTTMAVVVDTVDII